MYKLGILGVGKMGSSILNGIINANLYTKSEIILCDTSSELLNVFNSKGFNTTLDVEDLFKSAETILLSIKPQSFEEALAAANNYDFTNRCILSIAAGISIEYINKYFKNATIVRAMPNTPAMINCGVVTICTNQKNDFYNNCIRIFNAIGKCYEAAEEQMDYTLPLNGSMPAYLYYFAKAFIDSAVENGIDYETAKELTAESIISSAKMILSSSDDIDTLINNVCSKGGTTIAGLNKLIDGNMKEAIYECYIACAQRSKELNK